MSTPDEEAQNLSETSSSLEEASQGASNPADDVSERPDLPRGERGEGFNLGSAEIKISEDIVLEGEHLFGASPIFQGLDKREIREIIHASEKLPVRTGGVLFAQGDEASALYILQSGELQVRADTPMGEDVVLAVLGSGTIVGELALIDGGPRSATVEALCDCDIYRLSREAFDELRDARSSAAYKVILNLAATVDARRRRTERRIDEVFDDPAQHIDAFESQVHDMLARMHKA